MSDEEPMASLGDIEALLRENEAEAVKRIKARMACCALGIISMSPNEVACARAILNKHEADAKAVEAAPTFNLNLNGVVKFVEPSAPEKVDG